VLAPDSFACDGLTEIAVKTIGVTGLKEIQQNLVDKGLIPSKDDLNRWNPAWKQKRAETASLRRQYFVDCILTKTVIPMLEVFESVEDSIHSI